MAHKWSQYQEAVFNFIENPNNGSCVINAVAGSGKTTTIVEAAKRAARQGYSVLFLAFNKSIASELTTKMQGYNRIECKTLHAHGFKALLKASATKLGTDNAKWYKYVKSNIPTLSSFNLEEKEQNTFAHNTNALLQLCRINLITEGHLDDIVAVAQHHGIDCQWDEYQAVNTLLSICYRLEDTIDFTDMITLPCTMACKRYITKYDLIFVDECQDLSKAQQTLLLNSLTPKGRFIAVGDPKQAINGFCGADNESFYNLVKKANGHELPLSVCYRCGSDIIKLAQSIVPNILPFEGACKGEVIADATDLTNVKYGDMIICRKSAPLVSLCLKMIANGISAKVKGKDLAEGLKKLIEKQHAKNIHYLYDHLDKELDGIKKRVERSGLCTNIDNAPSVVNFMDKLECIKVIAESCTSISQIINKLDTLFADYTNGSCVTLSTIHKAKGLEADNVFIIVPNKLPLTYKGQQEWEFEQEMNLKYVAITRAKKCLTIVNLDEDGIAKYQF